jgi:DNA-binding response OmpR family regulator
MAARVLVCEDSTLLAALLKDALRAHVVGDVVDVYKDGPALLDAYRTAILLREPATLLVLDIELPGPSGLTIGRTCRAYEREAKMAPAPIVFFSGQDEDDEVKRAVVDCFPARYVRKHGQAGPATVALEGVRLIRSLVAQQ